MASLEEVSVHMLYCYGYAKALEDVANKFSILWEKREDEGNSYPEAVRDDLVTVLDDCRKANSMDLGSYGS